MNPVSKLFLELEMFASFPIVNNGILIMQINNGRKKLCNM